MSLVKISEISRGARGGRSCREEEDALWVLLLDGACGDVWELFAALLGDFESLMVSVVVRVRVYSWSGSRFWRKLRSRTKSMPVACLGSRAWLVAVGILRSGGSDCW